MVAATSSEAWLMICVRFCDNLICRFGCGVSGSDEVVERHSSSKARRTCIAHDSKPTEGRIPSGSHPDSTSSHCASLSTATHLGWSPGDKWRHATNSSPVLPASVGSGKPPKGERP
eukprot:549153-Amphidinium_carterae.1